jgi:DNA-binding GntR family transcriptional regulator
MEPPEEHEPEYPTDRVTRLLRARLAAGEWEPGQRMPSVAVLARELDVGHGTVRRALQRLADEGLVVTLPRYGTFRRRGTPPKD